MGVEKIVLELGKGLVKKSKVTKKLVDATSESLFSFAKKHKLFTKTGELADDGLALVHMTDFAPKTRQILSDRAAFNGTRNSVHTTLNHAVGTTNGGITSWIDKKYAVIMPFSKTVNANEEGKFIAGMTSDLWTNGSLTIPKGAVIVRRSKSVPKGKLRIINAESIKRFKHLKGVRIVETSERPHYAVKTVLKKMGYQHIENPSDAWGGFGSSSINPEKLAEEMKIWNIFAQKHGIVPTIHSETFNMKFESLIDQLLQVPAIKGVPLQIIKDGKVIVDFKQEILQCISTYKNMLKDSKIPISIDIEKFEQIVQDSNSFKDIYNGITKKLKLRTITKDMQKVPLTERTVYELLIHRHNNYDISSKVHNIFSNPTAEVLMNFSGESAALKSIEENAKQLDDKTFYCLSKYKSEFDFMSDLPLEEKPKLVFVD